jgi:hypothetical protein
VADIVRSAYHHRVDIRIAERSLRTIEDMLQLQARRAEERQQAVNQGLEHFVVMQQAKSKLVVEAITTPNSTFQARG